MVLTRKQKILIPLIILAFAYVIWQIYDLFGDELSSAEPASKAPNAVSMNVSQQQQAAPAATITNANIASPSTIAQTAGPSSLPNKETYTVQNRIQSQAPALATTAPTTTTVNAQIPTTAAPTSTFTQPSLSADQLEYLRLINQYQIVKMQRMILDEQVAIATSKEKISEIDQKLGVSVTTPTGDNDAANNTTGYKLVYIDYQAGRWTATLSKAGQYFEVNPGTLLLDGTKIISINQQGVTLQQSTNQYFLNFFGATTAPTPTAQVTSPNNTETSPVIPSTTEEPAATPDNSVAEPPAATSFNNILPTATPPKSLPTVAATTVPIAPTKSAPPVQKAALNTKSSKTKTVASTTGLKNKPILALKNTATTTSNNTNSVSIGVKLTPQQKITYDEIKSLLPNTPATTITTNDKTNIVANSDEASLLKLPSNHYVIQIMGNNYKKTITNFIKAHNLKDVYVYQTYRMGKQWYVLVYGNYATMTQAQAALKDIPQSGQQNSPWINSVVNVQNAIKLTQSTEKAA